MEERGPGLPPPAMDAVESFREPLSPARSLDHESDPPSTLPHSPIEIEQQQQQQLSPPPQQQQQQQGRNANKIVVQVPRDQVYRVPPPENAYLATQYQRPQERRRRGVSACCSRLYWFFAILLTFIAVLGVAYVIFYFVVRPRIPVFSVDRLLIVHGESKPEYELTIKVSNPSDRMSYTFQRHGNAVLSHRGANVASNGLLPPFILTSAVEDLPPLNLDFKLSGSDVVLPSEIEKNLKNPSHSAVITMILTLNFSVRAQVGTIESWEMDMDVRCNLGIGFSSKGTSVLKQDCKAKLIK